MYLGSFGERVSDLCQDLPQTNRLISACRIWNHAGLSSGETVLDDLILRDTNIRASDAQVEAPLDG